MDVIFLIGPPGSGKTVCGQALAEALNCPFHDTDQLIEKQQARTISEIFADDGEAFFRDLESQLLETLPALAADGKHLVLATGGGFPIYNDNLRRMRQLGSVVALSAPIEVLVQRVKENKNRPLLAVAAGEDVDAHLHQRLSQLVSARSSVYAQAGYKIDTSGLKPDEVAHEIIRMLYGNH